MQRLRNRNVLAVIVLIVLVAAVAAIGLALRAWESAGDMSQPGEPLYLLVTAGNTTYAPILLDEENRFTLSQGEEMVNVIHVTPVSVWMESATCDNQDCVEQGIVTAENRATRVLGNTIVCLPHRVLLELFTADELSGMGISIPESR